MDAAVPLVGREVLGRVGGAAGEGVDQDIEMAKLGHHSVDHGLARRRSRCVSSCTAIASWNCLAQLGGLLLAMLQLARGDNDVRAYLSQRRRHLESEQAGAAGDDGYPALKREQLWIRLASFDPPR